MWAASIGNVAIVRMLLDAGANRLHETDNGETAETYAFNARSRVYPAAVQEHLNEIIRLLRTYNGRAQ
jgi:ankyrin repeat protein